MKNRKAKQLLTALLVVASIQLPVMAADGTLTVQLYHDDSLEFKKGDYFTLSCQNTEGTVQTLEIDASSISESGMEVDIPEGEYQVTDITYSGGNSEIEGMGYGVTSQFSVTAGNSYNEIRVGVGEGEAEKLAMMYESVMLKQNGELVNELAEWTEPEEADGSESEDVNENSDTTDTSESESVVPEANEDIKRVPKQTNSEESKKESLEEKSEENQLLKAVPLFIFAGIGVGVIFFLHKKGKF